MREKETLAGSIVTLIFAIILFSSLSNILGQPNYLGGLNIILILLLVLVVIGIIISIIVKIVEKTKEVFY